MKIALIILLYSASAMSAPLCEVYGISDSPQSVKCSIDRSPYEISCKNGVYYLNDEKVENAYHMEVEEGPTPLVFQTHSEVLTINLKDGKIHPATLTQGRTNLRGTCKL
ncbi:MAG: hypothetical protein ACJ76H_11905 [Bacteriovoracaceae bacterium]